MSHGDADTVGTFSEWSKYVCTSASVCEPVSCDVLRSCGPFFLLTGKKTLKGLEPRDSRHQISRPRIFAIFLLADNYGRNLSDEGTLR